MMSAVQALQIHAGPRAIRWLRERGLQPADVRAIPAAAGGPKGLVLNRLDQFIFGDWLAAPAVAPELDVRAGASVAGAGAAPPVHLLGASIGAWRMAAACLHDPVAALERLASDYIHQTYASEPGRAPKAQVVTDTFGAKLVEHFGDRESEVLLHPRFRLHVFTSRGRHVLRREGKLRTPVGYAGAFATNLVSRKALGAWMERVVFSDARSWLPVGLADYRTRIVPLGAHNLQPGILASCSIPFWLKAVHDIPGAPRGAYWDGGITDYHLHLNYAAMFPDGVVLYPHFQPQVVPGWLDKMLKHRHRASAALDNLVLLSPNPEWVRTLPSGKLPDRSDFKRYVNDLPGRVKAWTSAVAQSQQLADEFAQWVAHPGSLPIQALR
jgi:hypothetical protein